MKRILPLILLLGSFQTLVAQINQESDEVKNSLSKKTTTKKEGWTYGGLLNIGINQAMLENWAAGGERMSLAANGVFNGFATHLKGNTLWENTLDLYYGLNYVASTNFIPRKLDDRIDFSSRLGLQPKSWTNAKKSFKKNLYFMGLFRFQSQFTEGYNYSLPNWETAPISEFLAPGYLTLALGAEYRPNDRFSLFFSPLAGRMTMVKSSYTEFRAAYGVEKGKTTRMELGSYLTSKFKTQLSKSIQYTSRLDLYSNYLAKSTTQSDGKVVPDNPGNIDILWDNLFAMKISKFLGAGLGFTMIYDNDIPGQKTKNNNTEYGPMGWWQLKQILTVGFTHKF